MRVILLILIGVSFSFAHIIVVDKNTNLMWQDNIDTEYVKKTWEDAKQYCEDLELDGYDDWFLPTVEQLLTITDKSKFNPSIKKEFNHVDSRKKNFNI